MHFSRVFRFSAVNLTIVKFRELFRVDIVRGTLDSLKQVVCVKYFFDYLDEIAAGNSSVTLSDILKFATATSSLPFVKYSPRPSISFNNGKYPTANTCSNKLMLPINCESYIIFQQNCDWAYLADLDFGLA
jgi:hypothetical protein